MNLLTDTIREASLHDPVLLDETLTAIDPADGMACVDATFGYGGLAQSILDAADCRVWGIDRDPQAISGGRALVAQYRPRLTLVPGSFGDMERLLAAEGCPAQIDTVVFDLGVSSPQLDTPERGFSFRFDGPLDMRMGAEGVSAADIVNQLPESELARVIFSYGEERMARRVARAIVQMRQRTPIERTSQLAQIVRSAVPRGADGQDPATRTFQALRIYVNDEIGELERGLAAAERLLKPGGRLAVISFHSLEDRTVKDFLRRRAIGAPAPSRHQPPGPGNGRRLPSFRLIERRSIAPTEAERAANPRSRSARLRWAERTDAPPMPDLSNYQERG